MSGPLYKYLYLLWSLLSTGLGAQLERSEQNLPERLIIITITITIRMTTILIRITIITIITIVIIALMRDSGGKRFQLHPGGGWGSGFRLCPVDKLGCMLVGLRRWKTYVVSEPSDRVEFHCGHIRL